MKSFNVVIKNWKTGEVVSTYANVTAEQLAAIEADHPRWGHAALDLEYTEA
jgi:hypothetical protein